MNTPQLTMNIILLYKDRAPCVKLPLQKTCTGKSCLTNPIGQMPTALDKGRDWVESITNMEPELEPELRHSPQPVEGVAALLVMGNMKIMP